MSLIISLDADHQRFSVELPSGHCITVPATAFGAAQIHRLLLAQKRADLTISEHTPIGAGPEAMRLVKWAHLGVGTDASPTQQEIDHIQQHDTFREKCPFCRDAVRRNAMPACTASDFD